MVEPLISKSEQKPFHEGINSTAKVIAQLRIFTNIPFAVDLARESGSKEVFDEFFGDKSELIIGFTPFIEARYKATSLILKERGINQVLEIASGLSPRSLEMTEDPEVVYVATDLPEILKQEQLIVKKILSQTGNLRPNLHFQVVNAIDRESLLATSVFFKSNDSMAVVSEGLFTYLSWEEKSVVASNILEFLRKNGGVWITSDVTTNILMERIFQSSEGLREIAAHVFKIIGRDIEKNAFTDEAGIQKFFREAGFMVEEYQHLDLIEDLSSMRILDIDREVVMKMLNGRKTLILTPQE